jgi:PTS system glucitol/sorbitol-specific IIA component
MNTSKYESEVVSLGEMTHEFIEGGILVFFGPNAPDELAEFAIIHQHGELQDDVRAGDQFLIAGQRWTILCVGEVANRNLRSLGHFVIKFNGAAEPELPGDISLPQGAPPIIMPGMRIQFLAGSSASA